MKNLSATNIRKKQVHPRLFELDIHREDLDSPDEPSFDKKCPSIPNTKTTNDRWASSLFPEAKKILTIAGRGDNALFYHLSGATDIAKIGRAHV